MTAQRKVKFVSDEKGKKTVVMPLSHYEKIMEELEGLRDLDERLNEKNKAKPFDEVKQRILKKRK